MTTTAQIQALLKSGQAIREFNGRYRITDGKTCRRVSTPAFNALRPMLQCREKLGVKNWTLKV